MNLKIAGRSRKLLLLAVASLCGLMILQVGQKMVTALELDTPSATTDLQSSDWTGDPWFSATPSLGSIAPPPDQPLQQPLLGTTTQNPDLELGSTSDGFTPNPSIAPGQQLVAVNATDASAIQQPIPQIDPSQISVNDWYGASFPVENFQAYTSPFGYRQSPDGGYSTEFHYGLDMAAPEGSYVRNWWQGTVIEVSDDSNCGTSVVLQSGSWTHIYCHMQGHVEEDENGRYVIDRDGGIQIWEGQDIPAGARIGRVGMTGRTTGPHLHWGLKYSENWVDPALVLRAMYTTQQTASQ